VRLSHSYEIAVEKAYIIRVDGNAVSEKMAADCAASCDKVKQPYAFWQAYNGHKNPIQPPENESDAMNLLRVTDHYLTRGEVACALSHISLWNHCVQIDQPIVILEHDALMVERYTQHAIHNSICYLGCVEQVEEGWSVFMTPPHASDGQNYHFMCRAHAYAIDPVVAKNLLAYVIQHGICTSLDRLIRTDLFPVHQRGVFAHDASAKETTILGRMEKCRNTVRNDNLET